MSVIDMPSQDEKNNSELPHKKDNLEETELPNDDVVLKSELPPEFKIGPAIWHSPEGDKSVKIISYLGQALDGRIYVEAEGYDDGVPLVELEYLSESAELDKPNESAATPKTDHPTEVVSILETVEAAKNESLDFVNLTPEKSLEILWTRVRELQDKEKYFIQVQEDIKSRGYITYTPKEFWDFSDNLNKIIGKLVVVEDAPSAEAFLEIEKDLAELKILAERTESTIKGIVQQGDEVVSVSNIEASTTGSETERTKTVTATSKVEKSSRLLSAWEKTEKFFKNNRAVKILGVFATTAARVASNVLGVKIALEGAVLGIGALKAKAKGQQDVWQKALANSSTDLGRYLYGGVSIFGKEIIKGDVKKRREQINQEIEDIFKEYEAQSLGKTIKKETIKEGKDELMKKFLNLDEMIKDATYLNDEEKKAYRSQLAKTIWRYRKESVKQKENLRAQIREETEDYVHNKALAYVVTKDAFNLGLAATGAGFLRAAGYAGFTALGRLAQANRNFPYSEEKPELSLVQIGQHKGQVTMAVGKAAYILKDLTWNTASETLNALVLRGRKKKLMTREVVDKDGNPQVDEKGYKKYETYYGRKFLGKGTVKDFAGSLGSVGTAVGLASLIGNEKFGQSLNDWLEKAGNNWSERGLAMFVDNFAENAKHMWHTYTNPAETFNKMKLSIFGGSESASAESEISVKGTEISSELSTKNSDTLSLEDQYMQKEHPGVLKDGYSPEVVSEITPENVDSIKEAIEQGELDSNLVNMYWTTHLIDASQPPTIEDINKFSELTTVEKGGSYWSTFMKQFKADPVRFGYEGDLTDTKAVSAYGKNLMANYAFREGLVIKNSDGSLSDIRIKNPNARIVWQFDKEKGLDRMEYVSDKDGAKFETYKHTDFKQDKTESITGIEQSKSAGGVILETNEITKDKVAYTEVNLSEHFRGAKSFDHKIRVFTGDIISDSGQGDGLVDHLRFTDDDGDELLTVELSVDSQSSNEEMISEIYQRSQVFDRSLTDLQAEMPESSKTLTLADQVKIGRLVVPEQAWFKDGAVHEGEWCEKLNKLDNIFASHKEYLADNELTSYIGQKVDEIDTATVNNLYYQGQKLRGQLGFQSVDYRLVQDYITKGKIIEFSAGNQGVEYKLLDQFNKPLISDLTGEDIKVQVIGTKTFNQETIDQYRTLAEKRFSSELNEYNSFKERVGNESLTKNILRLPCSELTDTEIAEMLAPTERSRAREIYDYLVQKIGHGNERALDNLGTKTVAEALSDSVASKTNESILINNNTVVEVGAGEHLEIPVNGGKVNLEYTKQGFDVSINANTSLGRIDLIEKGILRNDFMINLYHNAGGVEGMHVDKVEMDAKVLSVYLEAHQNLLSQGNSPAAERLAKIVTKQIDLFDKTYGANIFNRAKIESLLSSGTK